MSASAAVPVLQFGAGSLRLAVAAEDVVAVVAPGEGVPHIARILGIPADDHPEPREIHIVVADAPDATDAESTPPGGPSERSSPPYAATDRPVGSDEGKWVIAFHADPPLTVTSCRAEDIVPAAPGSFATGRTVLGFARLDGVMIVLLDIPSLVAKLLEQTPQPLRHRASGPASVGRSYEPSEEGHP